MQEARSWRDLNVPVTIGITAIHTMALLCVLDLIFDRQLVTWSGTVVACVLFFVTGWIGIGLCYHRLLTHDSFETFRWFRIVVTVFGALAFQGGPGMWVGVHKIHHTTSDTEEDPHSPDNGPWWAHVFWVMFKNPTKENPRLRAKKILQDPIIRFIDKDWNYFGILFVFALMVFGAGTWYGGFETGLSWLFWGVGFRTFVCYHTTWSINSIAHMCGYRSFRSQDHSGNVFWLPAGGEQYHNNHHAFPTSAAHGLRWYEIDFIYYTIRLLSWLGLVWNIKRPSVEAMAAKRLAPDKTA